MNLCTLLLVLALTSCFWTTRCTPSIFSVMYVPRSTELAQLGLREMMWGNNTVNWERLHTTVSMQTRDGQKAGCKYRVSVVPVDGDGLPVAVMRGQARELGCEVQLCGLNDGQEECVMSNSNYSDVMGKCHLSIPTSLAETGNTYRWVGVESTAISVEAGCQLSSESLPVLTALLEPYTAVYECASDEFWSQDVQECLPCETDDTTDLCSPGFYVKGCDSLAHVLDESTICSPCPNTPADFASGHYRWSEGEECVLECDPGLFYMDGTVCEPCTELLRTCTDEESNHCCAKQAGQMWRACTATENEACVDCPVISKSIYSENEEFIPWSHECEHYLQEDGDLSALCECHTTCKDGFYRSLEPDLLDSLPCVPCSGMVDLSVQARLTRTSNEFFRYQQCTKASNTQLVQCVGKPIGCDGVPYSTKVVDLCGVCGGFNDTCTGCDGVIASGKIEDACGLCDGDNTTCAGCDGVPNSGLVVDVCDQCGGDNTSCWGCDNISNSGFVFDACGECGGDGSSCWGCDNVSNSGLVFDACDVCGGDNATCTGCDGVLFSGKVVDSCGVCDGGDQAQDGCGVCYGDNTSCIGCDGIYKSGIFNDSCGVCGGDNSTCAGCDGIPYSGKVIDSCNVCGGDNTSCIGCDGVLNSGKKFDECNVCGGDNTTCECDIGYTGPQYGKLSNSCVLCGPGTYKDVIGSAACTECGFDTYNPQHGSTSSDACLPCMEFSETEEIYGHESIHACMCVSGYYHDTLTSCTACTPGTFNAEKNQTQCSDCNAGSYSGSSGSTTCQLCASNTYSHEGSALCTSCPGNTESPAGSTLNTDCICKKGYTGPDGGHCQACSPGTYKSVTGSGVCIACGSGTYSTSSAATTCLTCQTCASGQYLSSCGSASTGTCVDCLTEAAKCTGNTYLINCGASYSGACSPCASCLAGEQRNGCTGVSAGSCGACPSGTFKPSAGTEPCQTCPTCSAGKYQIGTCDAVSGNSCPDCAAGKYSGAAGLTECQPCLNGTFSNAQASVCTTCAAGKFSYSLMNDLSTCTDCGAGTYSQAGASVCLECATGMGPDAGASTCTNCVAGKYWVNGVCTDCAAGTYTHAEKQTRCKTCQKGKYNTATGQSTCTWCSDVHCPAGQQSACGGSSDSNTCVDCPANFYKEVAGTSRCYLCSPYCQEDSELATYAQWEGHTTPPVYDGNADLEYVLWDEYDLYRRDWIDYDSYGWNNYLEAVATWRQHFSRNESFINPFKQLDADSCGGTSRGTCTACAANEYTTSLVRFDQTLITKQLGSILPCRTGFKVGTKFCQTDTSSYCSQQYVEIKAIVHTKYRKIVHENWMDIDRSREWWQYQPTNLSDWISAWYPWNSITAELDKIRFLEPPPSNLDFHNLLPYRVGGLVIIYETNGGHYVTSDTIWRFDETTCLDASNCGCPSNSQWQIVDCPTLTGTYVNTQNEFFMDANCFDCVVP